MNINKKIYIVLVITLIVGFTTISLLPKELNRLNTGNNLRIGAGDDTSSLLLKQIKKVSEDMDINTTINDKTSDIETYEFNDC
ncbi:MAG: hypothetical protein PHC44_01985 [Lutispora sp.]|nr:hypothetical protein [Lutispora sp.]